MTKSTRGEESYRLAARTTLSFLASASCQESYGGNATLRLTEYTIAQPVASTRAAEAATARSGVFLKSGAATSRAQSVRDAQEERD